MSSINVNILLTLMLKMADGGKPVVLMKAMNTLLCMTYDGVFVKSHVQEGLMENK